MFDWLYSLCLGLTIQDEASFKQNETLNLLTGDFFLLTLNSFAFCAALIVLIHASNHFEANIIFIIFLCYSDRSVSFAMLAARVYLFVLVDSSFFFFFLSFNKTTTGDV
jgi:hypothetical protein